MTENEAYALGFHGGMLGSGDMPFEDVEQMLTDGLLYGFLDGFEAGVLEALRIGQRLKIMEGRWKE